MKSGPEVFVALVCAVVNAAIAVNGVVQDVDLWPANAVVAVLCLFLAATLAVPDA